MQPKKNNIDLYFQESYETIIFDRNQKEVYDKIVSCASLFALIGCISQTNNILEKIWHYIDKDIIYEYHRLHSVVNEAFEYLWEETKNRPNVPWDKYDNLNQLEINRRDIRY